MFMIADAVTFILILIVNVFVAGATCKYSAGEQEIAEVAILGEVA